MPEKVYIPSAPVRRNKIGPVVVPCGIKVTGTFAIGVLVSTFIICPEILIL
ncbi:hypothetical protein D3C85_858430 [compost metagenome]